MSVPEDIAAWVTDHGYLPRAMLRPGTRSQWIVRATSPRRRAVVITRGTDPARVREEVRALLHWRRTGITPRLWDMPDPLTLVLEDLGGHPASREPTRGHWSAREVGRALRILHDAPMDDAAPIDVPDELPPPAHAGLTRDLAGRADDALAREPADDVVIIHGDMVPANAHRTGRGHIQIIDPAWRRASRAEDLARYAMLIPGGDVMASLQRIWSGYGAQPTRAALAQTARMLATHLQYVRDGALSPAYAEAPLEHAARQMIDLLRA